MPIYLIERTDDVDYDETAGVVVIAETEAQALALAKSDSRGDERGTTWDSAEIRELNPDDEPGIVLSDFRAG